MEIKQTNRGFDIVEFTDHYGIKCSLQKSSLATEDCIWLGCDDADPRTLVPGEGWQKIQMPEEYIANTRMHLTREMVVKLIPLLQKFVETGELQ